MAEQVWERPSDQKRSWLVNKIRTDIAMIGTKLNAQVIIKNLQNMHAKSLPPTGARGRMELEYQDWARLHCHYVTMSLAALFERS